MPLFLGFALLRFHFGYSVLAIRRKNARVLPTFRNKIVKIGGSKFFGDHSCNISRRPHFLAQYSEIQLTYATTITLINLLKGKNRSDHLSAVFRIRIQIGSGSRGLKKGQKCQLIRVITTFFYFLVTFTTFF